MTAVFTIHELYPILRDYRAAVHEALQELHAAGGVVNVPFDAIFVCELMGLVVDLATGVITGWADERIGPALAPKAIADRVPMGARGEVDSE